MNKKSVTILWATALLLAIGVAILSSKKTDSGKANTERARGETLFTSFPAKDVAKLAIRTVDGSVTMEKKDGNWQIAERENYPAKVSNINTLLRTIEDLKINNAIEAGSSYAKRFGVDLDAKQSEQHGTLIEMSDASGNSIARMVLGKESDGGGQFVRNVADESGVYVTSEAFPTATSSAKDWLNDDFIKVEKITSLSVSPPAKPEEVEWKLTREDDTADFTLDGLKPGETINATNTSALKSLLNFARFQDVMPKAKLADHEKATDRRKLVIGTKDGFTYTITFSTKPNEAPPSTLAKPEDSPPAAEGDAFYMTVAVTADIKKERTKDKDEKPEDAKSKDEAYAATVKTLEEKLAAEKAYEGHLYEISKYVIDPVLKPRTDFITAVAPTTQASSEPAPIGNGPIEATTPAISIDGLPTGQ
jgi:hypothetical protein